jgi:hypothetical protein
VAVEYDLVNAPLPAGIIHLQPGGGVYPRDPAAGEVPDAFSAGLENGFLGGPETKKRDAPVFGGAHGPLVRGGRFAVEPGRYRADLLQVHADRVRGEDPPDVAGLVGKRPEPAGTGQRGAAGVFLQRPERDPQPFGRKRQSLARPSAERPDPLARRQLTNLGRDRQNDRVDDGWEVRVYSGSS